MKPRPKCLDPDPPATDSLYTRVVAAVSAAVLAVLVGGGVGGTALAFWYVLPMFFFRHQNSSAFSRQAMADTPAAMEWRFIVGAALGALLGLGLIAWFYWKAADRK